MDNRPIFQNIFSRDFTLATVEIWNTAESLDKKIWAKEEQPYFPYIIFERKDDFVNGHYDRRGIDWTKDLTKRLASSDKSFYKKLERKFTNSFSDLEKKYFWQRKLPEKKLFEFIDDFTKAWHWLEALWWVLDRNPQELKGMTVPDNLKVLRSKAQDFVPKGELVIQNSLYLLYPSLGDLVEVLRISEIKKKFIPPIEILEARKRGYFLVGKDLLINTERREVEAKYGMKFESNSPKVPVGSGSMSH